MQRITLIIGILAISMSVNAYYSVLDTGSILDNSHYRFTAEAQGILTDGSGANITGRFDTPVNNESELGVIIGTGKTDFQAGAFWKFIPFPDVDDQPAIGFKVGLLYARVDSKTALSTRFYPLVSKKFESDRGIANVYASLPIGMTTYDSKGYTPANLVLGSEYITLNFKNLTFIGELGLKLNNDTFSYFSLGAVFYFDEEKGFELN